MIFYIMPYLFIIFMALLSWRIKGTGYRILFFIGILPAFLLVLLRGEVGTDTSAYIKILNNSILDLADNNMSLEPVFLILVYLKNYLSLDPQVVLNVFSASIILVLFLFFSKSKSRFYIFSFLIFPIFLYDMTMNGVRYGMAFALACYFISESNKNINKFNNNKIIYILSILNHKTSLVFYFLKVTNEASIKKFIALIFSLSLGFFVFQDYLVDKVSVYSDYVSPSIFSGVQPLLISLLILISNSLFYKINIQRNIYLFLIQFLFYIITQYSYAGIRFQFLELFYIIIILTQDERCKNYSTYLTLLFISGLIGFLFRLNNIYSSIGQGDSPFLPYLFYWNK